MGYTSHVRHNIGTQGSSTKPKKTSGTYGKVVKVLTSLDDPDCKDSSMLNGVYYRLPKILTNESTPDTLRFAYQGDSSVRRLPLPGEMVEVITGPGANSIATSWSSTRYKTT
jgi:hypothetical protein